MANKLKRGDLKLVYEVINILNINDFYQVEQGIKNARSIIDQIQGYSYTDPVINIEYINNEYGSSLYLDEIIISIIYKIPYTIEEIESHNAVIDANHIKKKNSDKQRREQKKNEEIDLLKKLKKKYPNV